MFFREHTSSDTLQMVHVAEWLSRDLTNRIKNQVRVWGSIPAPEVKYQRFFEQDAETPKCTHYGSVVYGCVAFNCTNTCCQCVNAECGVNG